MRVVIDKDNEVPEGTIARWECATNVAVNTEERSVSSCIGLFWEFKPLYVGSRTNTAVFYN